MESLWEKSCSLEDFPRLDGDISTDVLVIGGGLAGILCAYFLTRAGVDCVVAEAERVCGGITRRTTAKITSQHGLIYDKLIREFDIGTARLYLRANEDALRKYRELASDIDCDFTEADNFVYSRGDADVIDKEMKALDIIGFPADKVVCTELPFSVAGAVRFSGQAMFNPLKFVKGIIGGLRIFEHTAVRELIGTRAVTDGGNIDAKRVIVATHFPFINKHGAYFLKMYQHRSYAIALRGAQEIRGMFLDEASEGLSFRGYEDMLILGGGSHRTGKHGGGWKELRDFAARYYPNAEEAAHWATQDCMTLDGIPYIGRYSPSTENLYVATGFNKWGMTSSMVAAELLTDMILNKSNPYRAVFDPARGMLRPQLAVNAAEAMLNLITLSVPRCPHMGCALKWNASERSWDCPCHGSRFSEEGKLIDNPATGDLRRGR